MVLSKGQVPPQPNFITEKSSLKLSERGIKVSKACFFTTKSLCGHTQPWALADVYLDSNRIDNTRT